MARLGLLASLWQFTAFAAAGTEVAAAASPSSSSTSGGKTTSPSTSSSFIRKADVPKTGREWVSLHESVEFLPAADLPLDFDPTEFGKAFPRHHGRRRRRMSEDEAEENVAADDEDEVEEKDDNPQYRVQPFASGVSNYDAYQQAWRMLGFMVDCDGYNGDDDGNSGSQDDGDTGEGCDRYVLWAAYVDLEYEGGGIGEYQFWDRNDQAWDTTTCDYSQTYGGTTRCAKMDCHEPDTHWSTLGFFKHRSYDDWMEQLFKHEGICIWTKQEYNFMQNTRETWPQGCILSSTTTEDGDPIYYHLKPMSGGSISLGLYTDTRCVEEYRSTTKNDPITIENVIGNILGEGEQDSHDNNNGDDYYNVQYDTLTESLAAWDSAFSIFKTCQPCTAYDRWNYGYNSGGAMYGSSYGMYSYGNDDGYNNYNNGADYDCYDDADYTNVNQCMKFMAKTIMSSATFRDMSLAASQGTLVSKPLAGYRAASQRVRRDFGTWICFIVSILFCGHASKKFLKVRKEKKFAPNWRPTEPLVFS